MNLRNKVFMISVYTIVVGCYFYRNSIVMFFKSIYDTINTTAFNFMIERNDIFEY